MLSRYPHLHASSSLCILINSSQNTHYILSKRLALHGFIVIDTLEDHIDDFYAEYTKKIISGHFKHREEIYKGFEGAEKALLDIQKGDNQWKPVVVLSEKDL